MKICIQIKAKTKNKIKSKTKFKREIYKIIKIKINKKYYYLLKLLKDLF